nr:immunoglobulin heavy chain junction region [Mus musculus]
CTRGGIYYAMDYW